MTPEAMFQTFGIIAGIFVVCGIGFAIAKIFMDG